MKKTILIIYAWAALLTVQAQSFNFGYCNGEVTTSSSWGDMSVSNTSAAIFIPASVLSGMAGNEITTIRAGMASRLNIDELTVWVRASLDGENLAEGKLNRKQTRVQQGWNEVNLNEPYTIENLADGLYVGYSYHHTSIANAVSVVGSTPEGTAFFKKNDNTDWQDISYAGAISIEAVITGSSLPQYDLTLNSVFISPDLSNGFNVYQVKAEMANVAACDVEGCTFTITGGGIDDVTHHVAQTIESGKQSTLTFSFTANDVIDDAQPITVSINSLDNVTDENMANNTVTAQFAAFLRNVLVEEFTTERCQNCPSGAQNMNEALHSKDAYADRVSVVCHHSGYGTDEFTLPCDQDMLWFYNEGGSVYAPAWMVNRQGRYGQNAVSTGQKQAIYMINSPSEFAAELEMEMALPTHLMLGVKALLTEGQVKILVNGVRDKDFTLENPLLTVYLTEDNIIGKQQYPNEVVNNYQHNHVIRAYNSTWGDAIEWEGNVFTANYTFDADAAWKTDDMKVVVLVANYDADNNLNCAVENSASTIVQSEAESVPLAIGNAVDQKSDTTPTSCYTLSGISADDSHPGIIIVRRADGSVVKKVNRNH